MDHVTIMEPSSLPSSSNNNPINTSSSHSNNNNNSYPSEWSLLRDNIESLIETRTDHLTYLKHAHEGTSKWMNLVQIDKADIYHHYYHHNHHHHSHHSHHHGSGHKDSFSGGSYQRIIIGGNCSPVSVLFY